jgi:hypothetical protein
MLASPLEKDLVEIRMRFWDGFQFDNFFDRFAAIVLGKRIYWILFPPYFETPNQGRW